MLTLKQKLMDEADLPTPKSVASPSAINELVIAKRHGAAGGKGYFLASSEDEYNKKRDQLIKEGMINGDNDLYLQEYTSGVLAYLQFFYSPLKKELEFFGVDKRHESNIEGLARIPAENQLNMEKFIYTNGAADHAKNILTHLGVWDLFGREKVFDFKELETIFCSILKHIKI